jgi:hypothetical protein
MHSSDGAVRPLSSSYSGKRAVRHAKFWTLVTGWVGRRCTTQQARRPGWPTSRTCWRPGPIYTHRQASSLPASLLPTCLFAPYLLFGPCLPLSSLLSSLLPTCQSASSYLPFCSRPASLIPTWLTAFYLLLCALSASLLPNCLPLLPSVPSSPLSRPLCSLPASASYLGLGLCALDYVIRVNFYLHKKSFWKTLQYRTLPTKKWFK